MLDFIGNEEVKTLFEDFFHKGALSGSFLFYGPPNVGKRTAAYEFARNLFCLNREADCTCPSCKIFKTERHPDFLGIGINSRIKVADVDELLTFTSTVPLLSDNKVVVINNAETMTVEAGNRLLKVMEDSGQVLFILVTSEPSLLLPTIQGRCVRIKFNRLSSEDLTNIIWKKMGIDLPKARLLGWIGSGSGIPIFDQAAQYISYKQVVLDLLIGLKRKTVLELLNFVDSVPRSELPVFLNLLITYLTDMLLLKNKIEEIVTIDIKDELKKIAEQYPDKVLIGVVNELSQVLKNQYLNIDLPTVLKLAWIKVHPLLAVPCDIKTA